MATITELVARIRKAVYGEEVRESIASAIEQVSTDVDAGVKDWLDNHPEATTSVVDGSISNAKLSSSLKESLTYVNGINKDFTLSGELLGNFSHSTTQIQGMTCDDSNFYLVGTSGDTTQTVVYVVDPSTLASTAHNINAYGHPNGADYLDGKLYIAGCMPTAATTTYKKLCVVNTSNWGVNFKDVPTFYGWWTVAWLKAYNNKYVFAGHREWSSNLYLFATAYGTNSASSNHLGLNKFVPWRTLDLESFSCDPAGMCQYDKYILICDAHLSGVHARNCIHAYNSDGDLKATLYLPIMGDNELEDVCVYGGDIYTVDYSGNIYKFTASEIDKALSRDYGPSMFMSNLGAGPQIAYINENGTETYQTLKADTYLLTSFRVCPWLYTATHRITNGRMMVRTGTGTDTLILQADFSGDAKITFCGSGKSGRALVYYFFEYTVSTPSDNNEYLYTLTTFSCTAHYDGTETTYTDPVAAANAGYFHGYTFVERLLYETAPSYNGTALSF